MEAFILNCDFSSVNDDIANQFWEGINVFETELSSLDCNRTLNIIEAFQRKVCVAGFPAIRTPGFDLAERILKILLNASSEKVKENLISSETLEDKFVDFYVALLKSGPGSGHCEFLKTITKHIEFKDLYGDKLQKVVEGFKAISSVDEADVSTYSNTVQRLYPEQLDNMVIRSDKERLMLPEVHKACLDLFIFYLVQLPQVPVTLRKTFNSAQNKIYQAYDRQPFSGLQDVDFYRKQLVMLQNFIKDPEFPQSQEIAEKTKYKLKDVFQIKDSGMIEGIYGDIAELLKALSLKTLAPEESSLLERLDGFYRYLPEECFKNPKLFEVWVVTAVEILKESPRNMTTGDELENAAEKYIRHLKPKAELARLWLSFVVRCCQWCHKNLMEAANQIIADNKWKGTWKWKENVTLAKEMIVALTTVDYSVCENVEDYSSKAESFVENLMKQLELLKVAKQVEVELAELVMVTMEAVGKEIMVDSLCKSASEFVSLQNNKHLIAGYLDRFLCLLKTEDYDWDTGWMCTAAIEFFNNLVKSSSGDEVRDLEMDDAFLGVFLFCLSEEREYISLQRQHLNIYGLIAVAGLPQYINLHREKKTLGRLKPLFPHVQRLMNNEEELISSNMRSIMQLFGPETSQLMDTAGMEGLIQLYLREKDFSTLNAISAGYDGKSETFETYFLPLIQTFSQKTQTNELAMQAMLIKKVSENQPELFTTEVLELLFKHHFMDRNVNPQVLVVLETVSKTHPENLEQFMEEYLMKTELMMELTAHYQFTILVRIAAKCKNKQGVVYTYLMKRLKESNTEQVLTSSIQGLRELHSIYGAEIFTSEDRKFIESLKTKGMSQTLRDLADNLIDELEGRSLEGVSKGIEEQSGQIEKLEVGVAGTKVVLKKVQRDVNQQGEEIDSVREGLGEVNTRVDRVEVEVEETKERVEEVDKKTMSNAPTWSRDVTKLLNPESEHDWRLLASRLGYSPDDIRGWATQSDPCMALLSEWYATHKTFEASKGVLNILQEMNRLDAAIIVENAMKAAEGVVADEPVDYPEPPEIFLSYQWGHQNEVKLISRHLEMAGYKCWMDVGQMGGGDKLFEKIDSGIRAAKVVISCVTEKYAKSPNCNREVNLSVNLGKPMIPLLLEKMPWPPTGSMGPIFSEYLFIRFFQRPGEETKDDRIWPVAKFTELLMQLNCLKVMPDQQNISQEYKNWWIPVVENIVIPRKPDRKGNNSPPAPDKQKATSEVVSPDIFISYQWGKQKEISALYQRLTSQGFTCWMDIHQMGGGDSLYDKIDRGVRGCKVVLSSVTTKYALSANCRREVSLADALKKPIIPMLMEKIDWPPGGPMSMVLTQLLYVNFSKDESIQLLWEGKAFDELLKKIEEHIPNESTYQDEKTERTLNASKSVNSSVNGSDGKKQGDLERENPSIQKIKPPSASAQPQTKSASVDQNSQVQSYTNDQSDKNDAKKKSAACCVL